MAGELIEHIEDNTRKLTKIQVLYNRTDDLFADETTIRLSEYPKDGHIKWKYKEELTIDRSTQTVDYVRTIGKGCIIKTSYYVLDGVSNLLDEIDDYMLWESKSNNYSEEEPTYEINVYDNKGGITNITGPYDYESMPDNWRMFVQTMKCFMQFYDWDVLLGTDSSNKEGIRQYDI